MDRIPTTDQMPFGDHALPGVVDSLRRMADHMPDGRLGLWGVSLLRKLCLAGREAPFDVTVFGSQKVRLHPGDNRCEKRAFAGIHLWDAEERDFLDTLVARAEGDFCFVDAGANVGLYTLSVRAACQARGVALKAVAVEPDPVNAGRLRFNLAASGASDVVHAPVALGAEAGSVRFASGGLSNRGEARVAESGDFEVPMRPLLDVVRDAGLPRIDAMKMDIEGVELPVLTAFLAHAPVALWPGHVVLETGRGPESEPVRLLVSRGYAPVLRTGINTILSLQARPARQQEPTDVET
ncbi:FkbM family methyltransferase [Paroceanicella profunda]|uniref:FkbM family methyltransferase n=1 Tax=Paroceanicella profunda TaxID=2579971 RepID=A0A5B8FWJ8_9RHOB|nr:FkbM family methyltransferase [Paroceanicella profunda]QDL90879.1 FkbM family methyltransferase [Paroceanicella profunda]